MVSLILTCAGSGTRANFGKNKLFISFGGQTVLYKTLSAFFKSGLIEQYIITVNKSDYETVKNIVGDNAELVIGGATRFDSVKNALPFIKGDIVLVHDGARPFVSPTLIKNCIETAEKFGSAIPVIPSCDTIIKGDGKIVDDYIGKESLYNVQTPQGFKTDLIIPAYEFAKYNNFPDDGSVYKNLYGKLNCFIGDKENVKLTYKEDFEVFNKINDCRVGTGFDCHRLVENRKLIIGGIEIPYPLGLLGHSDADVLTHAVMDAMLSAVAERDIGYHFPDTDERFKGASSIVLLEQVKNIIDKKGYKVQSVSAVIMAQKPKLLGYIPSITDNLAKALGISADKLGIGATTLEGLGFVGREEGICASATAVLIKK
ncbi:MAG: 2-C-methyl-D-erythritol 2,4-cyclodiphosphate synthase [Clostridia bacterium]|nr:2-C-methyl-D-erythritol 2,4-cyclodiphosphate synthase [Clostridia bacterium]